MKALDAVRARRCVFIQLCLLLIAIALESLWYPDLATAVDGLLGGSGGPGSSIGYFRDRYVLPGGIVFWAIAAVGLTVAARRSHGSHHRAAIVVWILNAVAFVASSIWYFQAIRAAENYRG